MQLATSGGHWTTRPTQQNAVQHREGDSLFYPGTVSIITTKLASSESGFGAAEGLDQVIADCCKEQATY
jgi:hypothetical protein